MTAIATATAPAAGQRWNSILKKLLESRTASFHLDVGALSNANGSRTKRRAPAVGAWNMVPLRRNSLRKNLLRRSDRRGPEHCSDASEGTRQPLLQEESTQ
jgi:hypothetical protein